MDKKRMLYLKNLMLAYYDVDASRKKLEEDPENTMYIYELGRALSDRGDYEEAVETFSKGLIIDPFNAHLYFGRGVVRSNHGGYWEGISDLAMATHLIPENWSFWYYLATAKNLHGDYAGSLAAFKRAAQESTPEESYPEVHWLYTINLLELNDPDSAQEALNLIPDYCEAPMNDYAYRRNVMLYKGLLNENNFIDMEDIKKHAVKQENRVYLELNTMYYGLYAYAKKHNNEELMDRALREIMKVAIPKAFGFKKCLPIAIERGIVTPEEAQAIIDGSAERASMSTWDPSVDEN